VPKVEPTGKVINLMDALRRSVQAEKATATERPARAKKGRKNAAQKEMLLPIAGKKPAHAETGKARSAGRQRKAG
jgi:DNA end-binding protein Ku